MPPVDCKTLNGFKFSVARNIDFNHSAQPHDGRPSC